MKKYSVIILIAAISFLWVSGASAGMYVGVKAGYCQVSDMDLTIPGTPAPPEPVPSDVELSAGFNGALEHDAGYLLGAAVGTTIENFRVEGELEFRSSDFEAKEAGVSYGDETLNTISFLVNGYYDFKTDSTLTPYVGAGIGFARHDAGDVDDTVFAYQATLGVAYALSETMDLDFAYRYFATADPEFDSGEPAIGALESNYDSHNLTVGIRFKL